MAWLFPLLMFMFFFACVAMLFAEGMWNNAIRLINVITAALLTTNFFEPLAQWLEHRMPSYSYVWDFWALWGLFALFVAVSRVVTDRVSKIKVRFLGLADRIGSGFFALWISWVLLCFTMMTLHTAPLAKDFLFDGFHPERRMIMGLAPDRQWLGFVQKSSLGTFCRPATPDEWQREQYVFDRNADFMPKYATRRQNLETVVRTSGMPLVAAEGN